MKSNMFFKIVSVLFFLAVLSSACTIPFYFESPSLFYKFGMDKALLQSGKIFGILAAVLLIFQPVFAARFKLLDKIFGQDRLLLFHKKAAIVLTCFAAAHPVFILWAENFSFFPLEKRYWPAFLGIGLFIFVFLMTIVSHFRSTIGLKWNGWIITHRILSPVILIALIVHILNVSKTFETGMPNTLLMVSAVFLGCLFIRKWVWQATWFKRKYRVVSVAPSAKDTWAVDLEPMSKNRFYYLPGQFAYFTPLGKNIAKEEHPFTIASSFSTEGQLQFVIRSCGDFTDQILHLQVGDTVLLDGPYGRFSHALLDDSRPVVMIAGGIGITPMLSMLRAMAKNNDTREIILIWSNKTTAHMIFEKEFSELNRKIKMLKIYHVITREPDHRGRFNRIDGHSLRSMLNDFDSNAAVFLCGPPAMVSSVKQLLKLPEYSMHRVYTESFLL